MIIVLKGPISRTDDPSSQNNLKASERTMYELDNRKDQVMTGGLARADQSRHVDA
jgi:hypothetical protein